MSVPVTVKSPVMVVLPLTARSEFNRVAVAVTVKSVVIVVVVVPSVNRFWLFTQAEPFQ